MATLRVVIADDNRDAVLALQRLLQLLGFQVAGTAFDGEAALELIVRERPDVALLDIDMPRPDGNEIARIVRGMPLTPVPRLIAVTGWARETDKRQASDAGFDACLIKPVACEALEALLRQYQAERDSTT